MLKSLLFFIPVLCFAHVQLGIESFYVDGHAQLLKNKKIALVTNHSAIDHNFQLTAERFLNAPFELSALWTPEHGLFGMSYSEEKVGVLKFKNKIPVYSLYGQTRRPSDGLLKNIDAIIYDIQDIGVRSYTYASTLYYVMEAAASKNIPVIVLDRPNPLGGELMDGPMLANDMRSFVGYVNVPYAHGMTIGELARFFNQEYQIRCALKVIPMKGWQRSMRFKDTQCRWIPTSPNIPEPETPFYCATTGILGELSIANIGIGYTMPFKLVGAPWIEANTFAKTLNEQNIPGVHFIPFHYRPFYGLYKGQDCHGILIDITDISKYRPLHVQYMLIGLLKSLYPKPFLERLAQSTKERKEIFCKVNGNRTILNLLQTDPYPALKCLQIDTKEREQFAEKRKKYLLY